MITYSRVTKLCTLMSCICFVLIGSSGNASEAKPSIQVKVTKGRHYFIASNLPTAVIEYAKNNKDLKAVFPVAVTGADTAMLGNYLIKQKSILFKPRFPLIEGTKYASSLKLGKLSEGRLKDITFNYQVPKKKRAPTRIMGIYPSAYVLPENQLKFYIQFSAPMRRGEAYQRISLVRDDGKKVDHPFLEIEQELWSSDRTRLTLVCDPGRVKRGLRPREQDGPILEEGHKYRFTVDGRWRDQYNNPLTQSMTKRFAVVAPDNTQPLPDQWKLKKPKSGTRQPLTVALGEPLDYAMLQSVIHVENSKGEILPGTITLSEHESTWHWQPESAWKSGRYNLVAQRHLEDRAGNTIESQFEVDRFERIQKRIERAESKLPFQIK